MKNIIEAMNSVAEKAVGLRQDYELIIEEVEWIDHLIGKIEVERAQTGNADAKHLELIELNQRRSVEIQDRELIKSNIRFVDALFAGINLK
ncbi:hypothetical protein [Arthrobacter sp. lap29]|uniref:hypothetical protein n=1 Tax=Arthrobacter sp. lap29 TaxID=3056122 RepID=UPI0028F6EDC7|nr:hypothetical protein [Arthrobacter sp. lap29]